MNSVVLTGLIALLLVTAVMIAAIIASIVTSTSKRRANELYWLLEDLLDRDRRSIDEYAETHARRDRESRRAGW